VVCADPGLAQLDRNINGVLLRMIVNTEADNHRAATARLHRKAQQLVGKRGYDLRQATEWRLERLNTIARQSDLAERPSYSRLDLAQLPVTMPAIDACPAVMGGLVPAIHVLPFSKQSKCVDARDKRGHDDNRRTTGSAP
jgi:hypothetical protein